MAKTDLQLKTLAQATGAKMTTTLTYVNPNANSATLKEFGQKLNNLTTNTYVETNRVQTINVDTEQVPVIPTAATLTLNAQSSYQLNTDKNLIQIPTDDFEYAGSSQQPFKDAFGIAFPTANPDTKYTLAPRTSTPVGYMWIQGQAPLPTGQWTIKMCIPGATQLENAYLQATITVTES